MVSKALHSPQTTKMTLQMLVSDRNNTARTRKIPTKHPVQVFKTSYSREWYVISSSMIPSTTPVAHRLWIDSNHSMAWGWFMFLGCVRLCVSRQVFPFHPSLILNLTFCRTNQPHRDDRNGSSKATSTTCSCCPAAFHGASTSPPVAGACHTTQRPHTRLMIDC